MEHQLHLVQSLGLPCLQVIDPLVVVEVLLSILRVLVVVLTSQHLFLFLEIIMLPGKPEQVHVEESILLGHLNHPRRDLILVVVISDLKSLLDFA